MSPYQVAAQVVDPELSMVTIAELGILRDVVVDHDRVVVTISPTYSGCPALEAIRADLAAALRSAGWSEVEVVTRLSPPWTTDWITGRGRAKLAAAGIAPPAGGSAPRISPNYPEPAARALPILTPASFAPVCPQCQSTEAEEISRFGATACTSLWRCRACAEPFPHVKPI